MSDIKLAVLFQEGKLPRIYKNPISIDGLEDYGVVLVNPKIPKGAPPHTWYPKDGKIMIDRDKVIMELGRYPKMGKEPTTGELERSIRQLKVEIEDKHNCLLSQQDLIKAKLIDKIKKVCNISILGAFILLFVIFYANTIKEIFGLL
jgi:hypothetical protein